MKNTTLVVATASLLLMSATASADWFGNRWNDDYNDWPTWTPMYWMQEMSDRFNNDGWRDYRYGPNGYGYPPPYPYYSAPNYYAPANPYYAPYPNYAPNGYPPSPYPNYAPYPPPAPSAPAPTAR